MLYWYEDLLDVVLSTARTPALAFTNPSRFIRLFAAIAPVCKGTI